jgi:hypothetical protein
MIDIGVYIKVVACLVDDKSDCQEEIAQATERGTHAL